MACFLSSELAAQSNASRRSAKTAAPMEWTAIARADIDFIHDKVISVFPGTVDPANPDFKYRFEAHYRIALERAAQAESKVDWAYSVQPLVVGIGDGHAAINRGNVLLGLPLRWPGFLVESQGGRIVVRRPRTAVPGQETRVENGWELASCDGVPAGDFARNMLDGFAANWNNPSERITRLPALFMDGGNPYLKRAKSCDFKTANGQKSLALVWSDYKLDPKEPALLAASRLTKRPIALRWLPDGGAWITLSSLNDNGIVRSRIRAVHKSMDTQKDKLDAAVYVVVDLRGNRGGNSQLADGLYERLFSAEAIAEFEERNLQELGKSGGQAGKLYRVSQDAIDALRGTSRFMSDPVRTMFLRAADQMGEALRKGDALIPDRAGSPVVDRSAAGSTQVSAARHRKTIFVLTDAGCFSSCIIVFNKFKELGAIQVGEITGRNTRYAENVFRARLPSRLGVLTLPIAIFPRTKDTELGAQPPDHAWSGRMDDDVGIENWIASLARQAGHEGAMGSVP